MPGKRPFGSTLLGRSLLIAGAVLTALLCLEIGARIVAALDRNYLDELVSGRHVRRAGEELTLADLLRVVANPRIVYALQPGARGTFRGAPATINSYGIRDAERPVEKRPGVFRIVGLGDSHMFGWGVPREETFLTQLESLVERTRPGGVEVWNLAVPGYNTVQEVQTFAETRDELDADAVILNWVANDMDLPNFLQESPSVWSLRKSFLREVVRRRRARRKGRHPMPLGLVAVEQDPKTGRYRPPPADVPERFRPLAGTENMLAALDRLGQLAKERGITPVLLLNWDDYAGRLAGRSRDVLPAWVRQLARRCASNGYVVVDPQDRITDYLLRHRLGNQALWVTPTDSHTSALRHRLVAEELVDSLGATGILPRR
ncbi:MAG: hypothetical protein QOD06_3046 [Candidatus Binatota bacterium]|nr:hypothetical protein [Candidatus Binatota bacterium]